MNQRKKAQIKYWAGVGLIFLAGWLEGWVPSILVLAIGLAFQFMGVGKTIQLTRENARGYFND